ncbi:MAG: septal ring lytic transglycosylase RlpA family protein [Caulobacteraceae bacterium]
MARTAVRIVIVGLAALSLPGCIHIGGGGKGGDPAADKSATLRPYTVGGKRYAPRIDTHYEQKGLASWYSYAPGTRRTATGDSFDPRQLTAAHKTLPLPCIAEVTNLENGRKLKVLVNDRGPFVDGRIIDLSKAAADRLGFAGKGLVRVKVKFVGPARRAALDVPAVGEGGGEVMLAAVTETPPAG